MDNWISVFSTHQAHQAEIVKTLLEEEELKPVVINKKDSSYKFGYYEVFVLQEEAFKAANLIENEIRFE
jgi:hypothetical protein